MHLRADELVDLAEGTDVRGAARHLEACAACRHQVEALRATVAAAAAVDVPEPPERFWDGLSERVQEAVAVEGTPRPRSWRSRWDWRGMMPFPARLAVAVAAACVLAASLALPRTRSVLPAVGAPGEPASVEFLPQSLGTADDPSLAIVADLTAQVEPEAALEAGFGALAGGVDNAVATLTDGERRELQDLLKEALEKPGA